MNDKEIIEKALDTVTAEERRKPEDEQEFFSPLFDERVEKMIVKLARQDERKRILDLVIKHHERRSEEYKKYPDGYHAGTMKALFEFAQIIKELGGERDSSWQKSSMEASGTFASHGESPPEQKGGEK